MSVTDKNIFLLQCIRHCLHHLTCQFLLNNFAAKNISFILKKYKKCIIISENVVNKSISS